MSYVYLLAGDDLELAEADLEGFLKSQGAEEDVERVSRLGFSDAEPSQLKRLALTHEVSEVLYRGDEEELETDYRPERSFAVRMENLERDLELESGIGEYFRTDSNEVDLERPEEVIKVYALEDEIVVGKVVEDIDRSLFEKRSNEKRPFSSPISLDPVLARVLVNLSGVPPGEHVFDPFCGTGGILIEAGLCGIGVHGSDVQEEMVKGTRENLEECGIIVHDIRQMDVEEAVEGFDQEFSAVITDLPYGQASKEQDEPVEKFLEVVEDLADKVVFMYNEPELGGYEAQHEVYVHKNLTRYIFVVD